MRVKTVYLVMDNGREVIPYTLRGDDYCKPGQPYGIHAKDMAYYIKHVAQPFHLFFRTRPEAVAAAITMLREAIAKDALRLRQSRKILKTWETERN